jgi:hypothetical protein
LCDSAGNNAIGVGCDNFTGDLQIITSTGVVNVTVLATASAPITDSTVYQVILHVEAFGAAGTATLYVDGVLVATYTGDLTVGGITDVDQVLRWSEGTGFGFLAVYYLSEIIVADEDPTTWGVATLAPNGAGFNNDWNNSYAAIDEVLIADGDMVQSGSAGEASSYALSTIPSGDLSVIAVCATVRAQRGATGITGILLGVRIGLAVDLDPAVTLTTTFSTIARIMHTNPTTSDPWLIAELPLLQLAIESAA